MSKPTKWSARYINLLYVSVIGRLGVQDIPAPNLPLVWKSAQVKAKFPKNARFLCERKLADADRQV
ncbi:MAG: hypothetical protein ABI557_02030 [Aureliella sp.]